MTEIQGQCDERFSQLCTLMKQFIESGEELGASIAVNLDGEDVVDIWGGYLDESRSKPWTKDTITVLFSLTKNISALSLLVIADRGLIDLDAPVAQYWPEFAANGKEDVLVKHVLSHSAGLSGWENPISNEDICDFDLAITRLAEQAPWWKPGSQSGYHAYSMGHLIGELVRRTTKKSLKEFIAEELAGPLHADFQLGAAEKDWPRISPMVMPPTPDEPPFIPQGSILEKTFTNPQFDPTYGNSELWRRSELGAVNGHSNARAVAKILSTVSLGGSKNGIQLLTAKTLNRIFETQTLGQDVVIGKIIRWGIGFGLTGKTTQISWLPEGKVCFWTGFGGSICVMDVDRRLTISYTMNKADAVGLGSHRAITYVQSVYRALGVEI